MQDINHGEIILLKSFFRIRLRLAHKAGNLVFSLMDEDSRTALILGVAEKGQPAIHLMNWKGDQGTVRARLMLDEDGNPDLSFTNENREIIKSL